VEGINAESLQQIAKALSESGIDCDQEDADGSKFQKLAAPLLMEPPTCLPYELALAVSVAQDVQPSTSGRRGRNVTCEIGPV
jgi:hypothetical protein